MSRQYLRQVSLLVGTGNETAIDLSNLRIVFKTIVHTLEQPNTMVARVYNLSDDTAQKLRTQSEGQRVVLQVGYEGIPLATLFDGTIIQVKKGREDAINSYVDIIAGDGDLGYGLAVANMSLAAGAKQADVLAALAKVAEQYRISLGYVTPNLPTQPASRGQVLMGSFRARMREFARSNGVTWSIQQQQIQVLGEKEVLPGPAVVLTPSTGLIGIPEVTADGIRVRCLINPRIRPNTAIQLRADSINQAQFATTIGGVIDNSLLPKILDGAGLYKVLLVTVEGDTRGTAWYSDLTCLGVGQPLPPNPPLLEQLTPIGQ